MQRAFSVCFRLSFPSLLLIDRNVKITCSADNAPRVTMGLFNLGGYPWFRGMGPSAFVIRCCEEEE